mgnify:FL=1
MVLFLFVVMMMDINVENLRAGFWRHFPLAAAVGVLIALEMVGVLMGGFHVTDDVGAVAMVSPTSVSNTHALGKLLYTEYIYPLEVAAAILLVAVIAAIALTLRARKDFKYVDPNDQVFVKARDRLSVVKLEASVSAPPVQSDTPTTGA